MENLKIHTLYSGSGGNCHYIRYNNTEILIDAGKSAKALCSALENIGTDISRIKSIYITHEHADHTSALRVLAKKHPQLSIVGHPLSLQAIERGDTVLTGARCIYGGESISEGEFKISAFRVPHDSAACLGYRIEIGLETERVSIGIATDIGALTKEAADGLLGCRYVIIEANHDTDMLIRGPYPQSLKQRVLSAGGHLSNEACAELCAYLYKNNTRFFTLAHLSMENNTPELAQNAIKARVGGDARVICAMQDMPVCLN